MKRTRVQKLLRSQHLAPIPESMFHIQLVGAMVGEDLQESLEHLPDDVSKRFMKWLLETKSGPVISIPFPMSEEYLTTKAALREIAQEEK
ncbi:MAG: hypothetical protein AAF483_02550 [Planctomycetota bacterium]